MSLPSITIATAAPARAAAGVRELLWLLAGDAALHASLIAVASVIPLSQAGWMLSAVPHNPPSGDNTVQLSAAFLDSAAASEQEEADAAPAIVMQALPVRTEGESDAAPRKLEVSPLAALLAPRDGQAEAESLEEAAAQSKVMPVETTRRDIAQDQPRVADSADANSAPSRSTSAAAAPPAVGSPDLLPSEVHSPFPAYPPELLARRIQATVVLRLKIAADGSIAEATVHRTSGYRAMDEAAIAGVKSWKFKPAIKDGQRVETIVHKPFTFMIRQ